MEPLTVLNHVHKPNGFVYGDCCLRRDKRGDSYLGINLLPLQPPGTRLQPLRDAPLSVRAGARPADPVSRAMRRVACSRCTRPRPRSCRGLTASSA